MAVVEEFNPAWFRVAMSPAHRFSASSAIEARLAAEYKKRKRIRTGHLFIRETRLQSRRAASRIQAFAKQTGEPLAIKLARLAAPSRPFCFLRNSRNGRSLHLRTDTYGKCVQSATEVWSQIYS